METPVQISFQGMKPTDEVREAIEAQVAELDQLHGRITSCHVSVTAPSEHHRNGGLYEVHIRLALPDKREVIVDRSPSADERLSDLTFAINDAFHRARRQLKDQVGKLKGQVKAHFEPPVS
jgi:ribosome-associated translation inhibitor RaiA